MLEGRKQPAPEYSTSEPGFPRLQLNEEGRELCVGCGLCSFNCPVNIIRVRAAKNPEDKPVSEGKAYARSFSINIGRCINCGYCEEACLRAAIKLSEAVTESIDSPENLVWRKNQLLEDS